MASTHNLKHIDKKTKFIVYGYIREIQNIFTSLHEENFYYLIPKEVSLLILTNVDDHFLFNQGTYQYIIEDPIVLDKIIIAENGQNFDSDVFNVSNLKWLISIFPNGENSDNINQFRIFLRLFAMATAWKSVGIRSNNPYFGNK